MKLNHTYQGDCLKVMKDFSANSIDTLITDPPYGLEFMGKDWDSPWKGKASKGFNTSCDGKLGGFKKLPNYTRGNNVKCLNCKKWKFSSNPCNCSNPKFPNTGQMAMIEFQNWTKAWATEALRIAKPGATLMCFGGTRTWHRIAVGIEEAGWDIFDTMMYMYGSGFPKSLNIGKQVDKMQGNERITGLNPLIKQQTAKTTDTTYGKYNANKYISKGTTEWEGWGTALKPAWEPIILARKPNEGTYANNALRWRVGGLNIDGGRVEGFKDGDPNRFLSMRGSDKYAQDKWTKENMGRAVVDQSTGRFPANVVLDEEAGKLLDKQSGDVKAGYRKNPSTNKTTWFGSKKHIEGERGYKDKGGASRFFYCAKASKAERNRGCEGMEEKRAGGMSGRNDGSFDGNITYNRNTHPTVKPLSLMKYLCTLTKTPTGGIVLDPFAGSGTTGIACVEVGRPYVLIEKEKDYVKIARARIKAAVYQPKIL